MPPAVLPAAALLIGAAGGFHLHIPEAVWLAVLACSVAIAIAGLVCGLVGSAVRGAWVTVALAVAAGCLGAGAALAGHARDAALETPLGALLDREFGGFALEVGMGAVTSGGAHEPRPTRALLEEDAARGEQFTSLRARVQAIRIDGAWRPADGGVTLSVGGAVSAANADGWLAGRTIEAPVTYRRPATYLNHGVPDFERELALSGTTLFGSIRSGLLVDVVSRGSRLEEAAARARRRTRRAIDTWVGRHSRVSSAIVTAVLIGDRTGLSDEDRARLQAAGTYHVIAISGGNIAILAALTVAGLMLFGAGGRAAALTTVLVLLAYAQVVNGGPSVWRATLMAAVYLVARLLDQRAPAWQAVAVALLLVVAARPLDVRDAGFLLTFGATAALLEVARRTAGARERPAAVRRTGRHEAWRWIAGTLAASLAAEVAPLPIAASTFSRITAAGLLLNLLALPVMAVTQVAGIVVVAGEVIEPVARLAGWTAHAGAALLVGSAALVDVAPWLTARVPPPAAFVVAVYYAALVAVLTRWRALRIAGLLAWTTAAVVIVTGTDLRRVVAAAPSPVLQLTMFDVGQGDGMLLELPDWSTLMVDAAGAPCGGGSFDIGGRVLAPALWARGVRALEALVITHGDPDHVGGAPALLGDVTPRELWEGIPVPRSAALAELHAVAARTGASLRELRAGIPVAAGGVGLRVLHPPAPDWERPRVRNDDSVVLEVVYGDVALLLTGDIGAGIEREILPQLTPARVRILKVAHHGSRTSTSQALLDAWRPQMALISCGRGNRFGHPAADVIARLESIGARIYRTDRDGQITVSTDGRDVQVTTFTGRR